MNLETETEKCEDVVVHLVLGNVDGHAIDAWVSGHLGERSLDAILGRELKSPFLRHNL